MKKKNRMNGLSVLVYNNNVEKALKQLKRKVKDSNLMKDLKERAYYTKPSDKSRHRKSLAKLRESYKNTKNM